jgi:Sec-independent protein secretion pathway component TatC
MKNYLVISIAFAALAAVIALSDDRKERLMLLIPLLIIYYLSFVFFSYDYDRQSMLSWKKKEKKVIEDTYTRFFENNKKTD